MNPLLLWCIHTVVYVYWFWSLLTILLFPSYYHRVDTYNVILHKTFDSVALYTLYDKSVLLYSLIYRETAVYKNSRGGNTLGMAPHSQILRLKRVFLEIILRKLGLPIAYEEIFYICFFSVWWLSHTLKQIWVKIWVASSLGPSITQFLNPKCHMPCWHCIGQ